MQTEYGGGRIRQRKSNVVCNTWGTPIQPSHSIYPTRGQSIHPLIRIGTWALLRRHLASEIYISKCTYCLLLSPGLNDGVRTSHFGSSHWLNILYHSKCKFSIKHDPQTRLLSSIDCSIFQCIFFIFLTFGGYKFVNHRDRSHWLLHQNNIITDK